MSLWRAKRHPKHKYPQDHPTEGDFGLYNGCAARLALKTRIVLLAGAIRVCGNAGAALLQPLCRASLDRRAALLGPTPLKKKRRRKTDMSVVGALLSVPVGPA